MVCEVCGQPAESSRCCPACMEATEAAVTTCRCGLPATKRRCVGIGGDRTTPVGLRNRYEVVCPLCYTDLSTTIAHQGD